MTICFYNYCKTLNLKTRKQFLSSIDVEVMPFIGPWEIALIGRGGYTNIPIQGFKKT